MPYTPSHRRMSRRRSQFSFSSQNMMLYGLVGLIAFIIIGYLGALVLFAWYGRDLPQPGKLSEAKESSTIFYDRKGAIIYEIYKDKNRVPVSIDHIPKDLQHATVAIEDKRFYTHSGISEFGILRAFLSTLLGHTQGGSTITQQLIKNVLLTSERSLPRKIKEAILAYQVESKYTKTQILEMYLNEAPYGGTYYGVGSASMGYFGKSVDKLDTLESAILAGLPQNPSYYSPFIGQKDAWKDRTTDVLRRMREEEYITREQEKSALSQMGKYTFHSEKVSFTAPHFIFYLRNKLESLLGPKVISQGVKVKTTLDLSMQQKAEEIVKKEIISLKDYKVGNGALVAIDPANGDILAYVGSYDYNDAKFGKFDVVSQGDRQPGSTLKPIEYAVAFQKGYTPSTVLMDVKTEFPNGSDTDKNYMPENYDGKYRGPVQIRFALGNSLNVPAVKMLAMIGIRDFLSQAYEMGLENLQPTDATISNLGLSASLGGGESTLIDLVRAYSVFANGGSRIDVNGILEVTDFQGKKLYSPPSVKKHTVLSPEISFLISHILSDNNARLDTFGPNSYLNVPGKTVSVKTGTTDDKRDNWAIGFTKGVALGVWVGNNDNSVMNPKIASGATGASPIWYKTIREFLSKYPDGIMDKPDNVKALEIDGYLGGVPKDGYPKRTEYFIQGSEPTDVSPFYKRLKISKSNGKLANEVEVKSGNYEEKDFIVFTERDPISGDGKNRWQEAIDAWVKDQGDSKFHPPNDTSDASSDSVIVSIKEPGNDTKVQAGTVTVRVKIVSVAAMKQSKIWINDEEKKIISGDVKDIAEPFQLSAGTYTIKVQSWNDKDKSGDSSVKVTVE